VRRRELEGLVAKRVDSKYEPGASTGAWRKMWVKHAHDFVIGGYTVTGENFDALIFGYYDGDRLLYAARTRIGCTQAIKERLKDQFRNIETSLCPFANLPEKANTIRRGVGVALTVGKMKECHWLQPVLVGEFEFLDWTEGNRVRYSKFLELQAGKDPRGCTARDVGRETLAE
jgi:bifunctional non-homologous end joining protein LigD